MQNLIFLLLTTLGGNAWALGDTVVGTPRYMVTEHCAVDSTRMSCWGRLAAPDYYQSATFVSTGPMKICSIDARGLHCWDGSEFGSGVVPKLKSPTQVSVGGEICAIDDGKVVCWNGGQGVRSPAPDLTSVVQISAGGDHSCALGIVESASKSRVLKCWSSIPYVYGTRYTINPVLTIPELKSPVQVSAGGAHTCVLDAEGVKCWGDNHYGQTNVPPLKSPIQVSAGDRHTCALDIEGVKCWGDNYDGKTQVPKLLLPYQIHAGAFRSCALDLEGVKCWGNKGDLLPPLLVFDSTTVALEKLAATRSEYLKIFSGMTLSSDFDASSQYLKYLLVSPAILSSDSSYFVEEFIPAFKEVVGNIQQRLGYSNVDEGFRKSSDKELNRKLAVMSIQSSFSVGINFVGPDMQNSFQEGIRLAGGAFADPMNNQKILDLLKQVDSLTVEKQKLRSSTKSAFLVDTLELAANWLREKVK